jgi:hypothetical protein
MIVIFCCMMSILKFLLHRRDLHESEERRGIEPRDGLMSQPINVPQD